MIISSEHHDLIKQFEEANEIEGKAIRALRDYMASASPVDYGVLSQLTIQMEETHERKMQLHSELKKLDLSRPK